MKRSLFSGAETAGAAKWGWAGRPPVEGGPSASPPSARAGKAAQRQRGRIVPALGIAAALSGAIGLNLDLHRPLPPLSVLWPWSAIRDDIPASDPMPVGASGAPMPNGYIAFCLSNRSQCEGTATGDKILRLDVPVWQTIQKINLEVNEAIRMRSDIDHYGRAEVWTLPADGRGDCEDYALAKQKRLMEMGLSLRALRLAVVDTRQRIGHVVLTVVTDKGDYVLDNLTSLVLPWRQKDFTWYERQDPDRPWAWVQLNPKPAPLLVSSIGGGCPA